MALPTELWSSILRFATDTPRLFETSYRSPLGRPSYEREQATLRILYRDSMGTKRSVSKVCSTWNSIVIPFMWEAVLVASIEQSNLLTGVLSMRPHLGTLVRRFEIIQGATSGHFMHDGVLRSLLDYFPNLEVCVLERPSDSHSRHILESLLATPRLSLKTLVYGDIAKPTPSHLLVNLTTLPSLTELRLAYVEEDSQPVTLHFPTLCTFSVACRTRSLRYSMPQLLSAAGVTRFHPTITPDDFPNVQAISASLLFDFESMEINSDHLLHLTDLMYDTENSYEMRWSAPSLTDRIQRIGIATPQVGTTLYNVFTTLMPLCNFTKPYTPRFPNLRVVRFTDISWMNERDKFAFRVGPENVGHYFWMYWARYFEARNTRMEDAEGRMLQEVYAEFPDDETILQAFRRGWEEFMPSINEGL